MIVAARTGVWAKSEYTAKDYVQDGLIAMWDGIENAGWGVHDPNATVWKDLVGQFDMRIGDGTVVVNSDNFQFMSGEMLNVSKVSQARLIEICFKINLKSKSSQELFLANQCSDFGVSGSNWGGVFIFFKDNIIYCGAGNTWNKQLPNSTNLSEEELSQKMQLSVFLEVNDGYVVPSSFRLNNSDRELVSGDYYQVSSTTRVGRNAARPLLDSNVYFIRLYSRNLTESEFYANYAIDKARFNLQ